MRRYRGLLLIFLVDLALHFRCQWKRQIVGDFDLDLIKEFFQGFVNHAGITLHIENFYGDNAHHQCESIFKCFALALRQAVDLCHFGNSGESVPSTKEFFEN